ncbi:hypothetical protein JCM5353_006568 [Sporobolomyces roseus]
MAQLIGDTDIKWWQDAIIYQIYPKTFLEKDSSTGGGNLQGILSKIPYLASLGVDAIWISPFYKSPQADLGYDISDYTSVDPPYGKLEDIDAIIAESKKHNIKILCDLVVNHCSNEHEWFKEACSSKDSPKRDWFIWRDARMVDGKREPPCNWRAAFGGPTWTWHEGTQQYYFHTFLSEQPELNWEVKECREAIYEDAVRFWLKRGVAGFRVDTVNMYSKDTSFPDVKITDELVKEQPAWDHITNGPREHEYLKELRKEALGDALTIGELPNTPKLKDVLAYISRDSKELDTVIQFDLAMVVNSGWKFMKTPWHLRRVKQITKEMQLLADPSNKAWAINHLENHDISRVVSRFGNDSPEYRVQSAKMLATYFMTLSGTPIVYQGQEIGMVNIPKGVDVEKEYKDCDTIGWLKEVKEAMKMEGADPDMWEKAIAGIQLSARDHARTPMNWDSSKNGGFSDADECWMLAHSFKEINVKDQEGDDASVLNYYRRVVKFRKENKDIFTHGAFAYDENTDDDDNVFVYTKTSAEDKSRKAVVVLNFRDKTSPYSLPAGSEGLKVVMETGNAGKDGEVAPYSAKIYM